MLPAIKCTLYPCLANSFAKNNQWKRTAETLLTLCRSQLAQKKDNEANSTAETFLKNHSSSPLALELHYRLGEFDYEQEKYKAAQEQKYQEKVKNNSMGLRSFAPIMVKRND